MNGQQSYQPARIERKPNVSLCTHKGKAGEQNVGSVFQLCASQYSGYEALGTGQSEGNVL